MMSLPKFKYYNQTLESGGARSSRNKPGENVGIWSSEMKSGTYTQQSGTHRITKPESLAFIGHLKQRESNGRHTPQSGGARSLSRKRKEHAHHEAS